MIGKRRIWLAALLLTLVTGSQAWAFPPFQWPWFEAKDCPRSSYCCLHYWTPTLYTFRAYHTQPRYVYGCPTDPAYSGYRSDHYPCRASSPAEQAAKYLEVGRDPGGPTQEVAPMPAASAPDSKPR